MLNIVKSGKLFSNIQRFFFEISIFSLNGIITLKKIIIHIFLIFLSSRNKEQRQDFLDYLINEYAVVSTNEFRFLFDSY